MIDLPFLQNRLPGIGTGVNTTATFWSKTGEGTFAGPYQMSNVRQSAVTQEEVMPSGRRIQKTVTTFRFYRQDLDFAGAPNPKVDDKVTDAAGNDWYVKERPELMLGQVWNMETVARVTT